jgi:small conductance mechanosensitive channel
LIQKKKHNYSEDKIQGVIRTLVPVVRSGVGWILAILFILIILSELHINIEPIIYSLGVLSLAFSIGGQMLVRDFINGFLALFEGSISVGDYVKIGEAKGIVEEISLRCVYLRYHCGTLHVIPFSEVTNVINFCKDYKIHIIHLKIPTTMCYEDIEKIIQETSKDISLTPSLAFMILEPLSLKGISKYTYDSVEIIVEIKTLPDPEDIFFFAVNSKIKNAFDQKALSKTDLKKDNIF